MRAKVVRSKTIKSPQECLAEFCTLYRVAPLTAENRAMVIARSQSLINEERREVLDANEYFRMAEAGSPKWWKGFAHLAKELADLKYVTYYVSHVLDLPIEDTPETRWELTGRTTGRVLDSLKYLDRHTLGSVSEVLCLDLLQGDLSNLARAVDDRAEKHAIPMELVFDLVHASNMNKKWDDGEYHYDELGKLLKPPNYVGPEPEIEKLLRERLTSVPAMA